MPWDVAGFKGRFHDGLQIRVPEWVSQDDELKNVSFTEEVQLRLRRYLFEGCFAPLYVDLEDFDDVKGAISEVLAQDPRGAKQRGTVVNDKYRLMFASVEIEFSVSNDSVSVVNINSINLDSRRSVDGVPLYEENC